MECKDRIVTQEEYAEIQAQITWLRLKQSLTGQDNSEKIKELEERITKG